jgi:hypothetical protein
MYQKTEGTGKYIFEFDKLREEVAQTEYNDRVGK